MLSDKRLLVLQEMLQEIGHQDTSLVLEIMEGFSLTGVLPRSGVFQSKYRPSEMPETALRSGARLMRRATLATIQSSGDARVDQGVYDATLAEVRRGFAEGPVPELQLPADATVTPRFGVVQSEAGKVRPIDDYRASAVNATVSQSEQVPVHTLDVVAALLAAVLKADFGGHRIDGMVCKCWDLSAAYKQVPLSDLTKAAEIFRQKVLPFGSRASVAALIRCGMAIWMLGVKGLSLLWTCYFDDYLHLAKDTESRHLEVVISTFFHLIGWRVSEDKLLPYDTCCKVLGIRLDLKDFKLGIAALANSEKRQTELRQSLEEVIVRGFLQKAEGEKLRGRMQFASGQLFGRRAKTALRTLGGRPGGRLSDRALDACKYLLQMLVAGRPREVSSRLTEVFHIYVDASFSPNGFSGVGGLVLDMSGNIKARFGEQVPEDLVRALQSNFGTERETVIFELESLAVYLSLQLFETTIRGANIVMFTDNEGVHGAFVRNWTENAFVQKIIDDVGTAEVPAFIRLLRKGAAI